MPRKPLNLRVEVVLSGAQGGARRDDACLRAWSQLLLPHLPESHPTARLAKFDQLGGGLQ